MKKEKFVTDREAAELLTDAFSGRYDAADAWKVSDLLATRAALIKALEDLINGHPAVNGDQAERLHAASDLLNAVKS